MVPPVKDKLKFVPVSESYVYKLVDLMKSKESSSNDSVRKILLKKFIAVVKQHLTLIINRSICDGIFPNLMKIAKVLPLQKGGEQNLPDNYRPVSLLPVFSKVLERVIYDQMVSYLNGTGLIFSKQYGFRKKLLT